MGWLLASCSSAPREEEEVAVAAQVQALTDSIVDDTTAGVTFSSGWTTRSLSGAQGGSYRYSGTGAQPSRFVRWPASSLDDGAYAVFMWWPASSVSRADAAPVTITYGSGAGCTRQLTVNQGVSGGQWVRLGGASARFDNPREVRITAADSGYTIADAVRFQREAASGSSGCVPPPPPDDDCDGVDDDSDSRIDEDANCAAPVDIIIDNAAGAYSCCFTTTGSWTSSTASPGYFNTNYVHGGSGDATKTARFTPNLPTSGAYEVSMWWSAASNRPTAAPVTVAHSGCTSSRTVNQEQNGGRWNVLGIYDLEAGTGGYVQIRGAGDGYTIADAVRFRRLGPVGSQPNTVQCCIDEPESSESADWPTYGRGFSNTFANPDETILTPTTVRNLRSKWTLQDVSAVSNPIVVGSTLYWIDWKSILRAHDLSTGTLLWQRTIGSAARSTSTPAVDGGVIYTTDHGGMVKAFAQADGTPIWAADVSNPSFDGGKFLWSSPRVVDGRVLVATGDTPDAANRTFRGEIIALDRNTGAELWRTLVQPLQYGAGVSVWSTPAIDQVRNMMYVGTGNAYRSPAGPYSDALLALDYENGDLLWSDQYEAGDNFSLDATTEPDWDIGASPNLYTRGCRDFVGVGSKEGIYRAFDRATGLRVWEATISSGSALGGVMATAAYHDGVLYISGHDFPLTALSQQNWNSTSITCRLQARDAVTGATRWALTRPTACLGAVTYAGGVVYTGTSGGRAYAFDALTGAELWNSGTAGTDAYRIGSAITVIHGHVIVTEGFQFRFVKSGPGEASVGGIRVYGLP